MVQSACHCGAVRITMDLAPEWVCDCNCSLCRRYGVLWAYTFDVLSKRTLRASLVQGDDHLEAYCWGAQELSFWRCSACGCVTHHTVRDQPSTIRGVNARLFADFDPARVTINRSDNAHTGWFWTRPDAPVWPGPQPALDPPGPDDWR